MTDDMKMRILNETFKDFHHARRRTIGYCWAHVKGGRPPLVRTSSSLPMSTITLPKALIWQPQRMVPGGRVELPLSCENRILSPARLPVPPSGHKSHKGATSNMKFLMGQSAGSPFPWPKIECYNHAT